VGLELVEDGDQVGVELSLLLVQGLDLGPIGYLHDIEAGDSNLSLQLPDGEIVGLESFLEVRDLGLELPVLAG
jgi:hypothetical protein